METKVLYEVTNGSNFEQMATMLFALQKKKTDFDPSKTYRQKVKATVVFDFQKQEVRTKFFRND